VVIGLLTGNIEPGARRKLDASGIGFDRFRVGVFGSDHEHRNALPAIAARRAEALVGVACPGDKMVIVGDTPADIACGEAFGARTVAVATGVYGRDELRACKPDRLFDSLEDTTAVWEAIVA
jgi:phosphoglycolate phosphatase-like HAD superfamily hydrolase